MPGASTSAALNRAVHRYRAAPLGARLFVHGRAFLSDLAFVERFVPKNGFIVDEAADRRRIADGPAADQIDVEAHFKLRLQPRLRGRFGRGVGGHDERARADDAAAVRLEDPLGDAR